MFTIPSLSNPVLLTVFYRVVDNYHAEISIKGSNEPDSTLNVIYDSLAGIRVMTIDGDKETDVLHVQDCEILTVHIRRESTVVGIAIFQVDVSLAGTHGLVLSPAMLFNVDQRQEEELSGAGKQLVEGRQLL